MALRLANYMNATESISTNESGFFFAVLERSVEAG